MQRLDVHDRHRCHAHLAANRRVEHPERNFDTARLVPRFQSAMGDHSPVVHSRQKNPDGATKPRVPRVKNFSRFGTMGVRLMTCTTAAGRTPVLTDRHLMTCTSSSRRYDWRRNPQSDHLTNPKYCPTAWDHLYEPSKRPNPSLKLSRNGDKLRSTSDGELPTRVAEARGVTAT